VQDKQYGKMSQEELINIIHQLKKENMELQRTLEKFKEEKMKEDSFRKLPYMRPPWLQ